MNTSKPQIGNHFYEFGAFRIDMGEKRLFHQQTPIPLTPKAFDTLLALVENPGHILEKDELMKRVWPDTVVEENNLTQNISALRKALGRNSGESPYIETIPRRGYRFAATVQERWEEAPQPLLREPPVSPVTEGEDLQPRHHTMWLVLRSILGLAVMAIAAYFLYSRLRAGRVETSGSPSLSLRPSVAVLDLRSLTPQPDAAWLSTAIPEMLTSELAAGEQLRAIPGENIARMKLSFPLADRDSLAPDTLSRIRALLGADYVVLGSYTAQDGQDGNGQIRLDLRLQDARAGDTLTAFAETGTERDLFDLVSRTGDRLRRALRVGEIPPRDTDEVRAELPSSPSVAKLYADGIAKVRVFDAVGGRVLLEKAVAADPQFPLAHSALAAALSKLGYDARARDEAKKAFDLSRGLSRQTRLLIEGNYARLTGQWDRALDVYRTLFSLFPDNLDYGIGLMGAEMATSRHADAASTLASLRQLPPPVGDDPRIDLAEADWAELTSDFKRELAAAQRAQDRGQRIGATFVVARAQLTAGTALRRLGRPDEALAALGAAQRTFASNNDLEGVASAIEEAADVLAERGDLSGAREKYEQTLETRRATGDEAGVAASLNDIARMRWRQADLDGARQMFEQAVATHRQIGDNEGVATALNNIGNVFYDQGDLAAARRIYDESASKSNEIGDQAGAARALINIALVASSQGSLVGARSQYEQAIKICRELGIQHQLADALAGVGDVDLAQDNLADARKEYEQSLTIRRNLGEKGGIAESEMDLASLAIEEGKAADAERVLPPAIEEARLEGQVDDEAFGQAILARALMDQRKISEAKDAAGQAVALAANSHVRVIGLIAAIVSARVEAASGGPQRLEKAQQSLAELQIEATKAGFVDRSLEARLAADEIGLAGSHAAASRSDLQELHTDAQRKGFGLISHKAKRLLKQPQPDPAQSTRLQLSPARRTVVHLVRWRA